MFELRHALVAFGQTLWVSRHSQSRESFERWQARAVEHWLARDVPKVEFYNKAPARMSDLPIVDKALMMARFEDFNRGSITAQEGWCAFEGAGQIGDISVGASTGTSGNRSLYVITQAERFRWLGIILAKTIPGFMFHRERVAVLLPQVSVLYDSANSTGAIRLRFFDLSEGPEVWQGALEAFDPTSIIAPPRVLRHLAETSQTLSPNRLYAGAETLDPVDRAVIEARFDRTLGQIYMASEGLFGVTCKDGRLHLAEDSTVFEFEPVGDGLVTPLVTSFRRGYQIMARYRMNDLLRLTDGPCSCGSPLRAVDEVIGRMDDVFVFDRADGREVLVTPDVLRNAVLNASRDITDFRLRREEDGRVSLVLSPTLSRAVGAAAQAAVEALLTNRGVDAPVTLERADLRYETGPKLRRVENRYRGCA